VNLFLSRKPCCKSPAREKLENEPTKLEPIINCFFTLSICQGTGSEHGNIVGRGFSSSKRGIKATWPLARALAAPGMLSTLNPRRCPNVRPFMFNACVLLKLERATISNLGHSNGLCGAKYSSLREGYPFSAFGSTRNAPICGGDSILNISS
jgi:hypothetical protein